MIMKGREKGDAGIYTNWMEVAPKVNGVSGNSHMKCYNLTKEGGLMMAKAITARILEKIDPTSRTKIQKLQAMITQQSPNPQSPDRKQKTWEGHKRHQKQMYGRNWNRKIRNRGWSKGHNHRPSRQSQGERDKCRSQLPARYARGEKREDHMYILSGR